MDLIGIPYQIIIGIKNIENNKIEVKDRKRQKIIKVDLKNINQILKQLN